MSIPFMKNRDNNQVGVIVKDLAPTEEQPNELEEIAKDILTAINSNDSEVLAYLLKEAYDHCKGSRKPAEENTYDSQNQLAAQED